MINREDADSDLELIRVADGMRRSHEVIKSEQRGRIVENVYKRNAMEDSEELIDRIVSVIPPADHLNSCMAL